MGDEGRLRNKPCWCGSGKKYKHCHLGKDKKNSIPHYELDKKLRAIYSKKICLAPEDLKEECSPIISKAHSVSKNRSLRCIAEEGLVYAFKPEILKAKKTKGLILPEKLGINKASTFTGFCSFHDNKFFSAIEDEPFAISQKHCFYHGYRSLCRELYIKNQSLKWHRYLKETVDNGRDVSIQIPLQEYISIIIKGTEAGIKDLSIHKKMYDKYILKEDYSQVSYYVLVFSEIPDILCSTGIFPEFDFDGNRLQNWGDELNPLLNLITVNVVSYENGGALVMNWLEGSKEHCNSFIDSFKEIDDSEKSNAIIRFLFEYCENIFLKPSWWDKLSSPKKDALINRTQQGVHQSNCLVVDGLDYCDWKISDIKELSV